ncbi:glycosyltransferase involved in cell wall biosynthesis [Streptomyces sp. SAI-170]|uniref:glycosyltransferase family 4 protein n=1 Tax=Streptomyces sp. SAI-170 TaxID=3377729 RepID=UPI003C7BE5E4
MTSTSTVARPLMVAVSGPDHSGKTTLTHLLTVTLRRRGYAVAGFHCYGCVFCRRLHLHRHWRDQPARGHGLRAALRLRVAQGHALVETVELRTRLAVARRSLRRRHGRPTVIITDRGPLDTLAKFDPAPDSATARRLTRLIGRYDVTLLFDGPPTPLGARLRGAGPADGRTVRYERWARHSPSVRRMQAGRHVSLQSADALRLVLARAAGAPAADVRRRHVVISNFDNTGLREYAGGSAVTLERVARSLATEFEVTVVTAGRHALTRTEGAVTYRILPVSWAGPRGGQILFQAMLPFIARRLSYDLWLENFTPPFPAGLLPLVARAPVVGIDKVRYGEFMRRKYHLPFGFVERVGYRRYRDLIVMNHADAAEIRRLSPRTAVEVIPNGVDPTTPDAVERDEAAAGDQGYLLFLGRIDTWQKGLDLLLTAYAASGVSLPLVLAGRGTKAEEQRLARLLAALRLPTGDTGGCLPAVRAVGHVEGERKRRLIQGSTFVVMPSRQETFGVVALEAMAHGKAVVHFDLPALRWTGGAGVVRVPAFDVGLFADRIKELAADPVRRACLGEEAARTARRFTADAMAQHYLSLVERVLDEPAADLDVPARGGVRHTRPADTAASRRPR